MRTSPLEWFVAALSARMSPLEWLVAAFLALVAAIACGMALILFIRAVCGGV